jgi:adenosylcobinamide-GDP ribazoletransferase
MKDSRIGAMALVAIVAVLALKWSGLAGLQNDRLLLLVLVPAYARGAILFGIRGLPYGRSAEGIGFDLFETPLRAKDFAGLLAVVFLSAFLGWPAIVINLGFILTVSLTMTYYRHKIGCITGDMLGAMTEVTESVLFFLMAMEVLS